MLKNMKLGSKLPIAFLAVEVVPSVADSVRSDIFLTKIINLDDLEFGEF